MKLTIVSIFSILFLSCAVEQLQCARILAVIPTASYSHQVPYRPLWLELNKRGHQVVVATTNPIPNVNLPNFTQIDIGTAGYKTLRKIDFVRQRYDGIRWISFMEEHLIDIADQFSETVLGNPELQNLYAPDSNQKFDVVMIETLLWPAVYALAHRFDAPLIGLCSLGNMAFNEHALGGLVLPSHEYTWEMEANTGSNLPFWTRLTNYVTMWRYIYITYRTLLPRQQAIAEKYFGPSIPPMLDILKNMSVIFVDQADALTPARPKLANMITFTSFHVAEKSTPLKKDLQVFLDGATKGFIYFSLGSNAMSSDLPEEVQQVFRDVFAKLPYRVLWKYEKELQNKSDNVYTAPWLPQQSVLAHPNIKLFIYQGGLQSSEETIHFTVPVLSFPILADQDYQVARMEALGVGKTLDIRTVTREQLDSAIREIISDKQYKKNIIKLKELVNDNPYNMVDNLVWWTEFVIRHKGAPHLRSSIAWQPWYQRGDIDVIMFLSIVAFIILSCALAVIAKCIVFAMKQQELHAASQKKQKIS